MEDDWQNKWGVMKWADFCIGKKIRKANMTELTSLDGYLSKFAEELVEFRKQLLPGDELYFYDSDRKMWDMGFGCAGYAIVRDGELLDTLVLRMN